MKILRAQWVLLPLLAIAACSAGSDDQSYDQPNNPSLGGAGGGGTGGSSGGLTGTGGSNTMIDAGSGSDSSEICTDSVDVVFVLDVSSSMGFVLDALSEEIGSVVQTATQLTQDSAAEPPHFGLIPFVDNHVIDLGGGEAGGAIHLEATTLSNAFQFHRVTFTNPNRNPGDGPDGPTMQNPICEENALDALHAAAVDFPWRPTATHVIIVATDDTFLERDDNYGDRDGDGLTDKTDFPREGDYPALWTVPETVDALKTQQIRVFTFTARFDALHPCGTGRRLPKEARAAGWSAPYFDNQPIPASTDGADFDLEQVRSNQLSLSETINDLVLDSHCNPPVY